MTSFISPKAPSEALFYHMHPQPGKIRTVPAKEVAGPKDLSLAYTPGVAEACQAIASDAQAAFLYTNRQHLIAIISNGTSVLGLGDIGALASKPVMEGKAMLFQIFGRLNAVDIEINEKDPQKLVDIIASLAPSFGGINLEDIKAPECFYVEDELKRRLNIPVFHDDQHGTAVVVAAVMLNALNIVGKKLEDIRCVVSGAGASALSCLKLLRHMGLPRHHITVVDSAGIIHAGRQDLTPHKQDYAHDIPHGTLADALQGADVFLGLSRKGLVTPAMITSMAPRPIVLALANPDPEITPEEVLQACPQAVVGTGRSNYPNQVNNLLCFPYIFRGAVDIQAPNITENMKIACAQALAAMAQEGFGDIFGYYGGGVTSFGPQYFVPNPFDVRLLERLPLAVAKAALEEGVALPQHFCLDSYAKLLHRQAYEKFPALGHALRCCQDGPHGAPKPLRYVLASDKDPASGVLHKTMVSAAAILAWYNLAAPIIVGTPHQKAQLCAEIPQAASWTWHMESSSEEDLPTLWASQAMEAQQQAYLKDSCVFQGKIAQGGDHGMFWCSPYDGAFTTQGVALHLQQAYFAQGVQAMESLGFLPSCVGSESILTSWAPTCSLKNLALYSALPQEKEKYRGYLWVGDHFPLTFPQDVVASEGNMSTTFILGPRPWQQASPQDTLSTLLERSAFLLYQG